MEGLQKAIIDLLKTDQETAANIASQFREEKYTKGTFLVKTGHPHPKIFFVVKGILRMFHYDKYGDTESLTLGNEKIRELAFENDFTFCIHEIAGTSLEGGSTSYLQALEDTVVLEANVSDLMKLVEKSSVMGQFVMNMQLMKMKKLNDSSHLLRFRTPKDLKNYIQKNAERLERIPKDYIASYLNITTTTLDFLLENRFDSKQ